MQSKPCPKCSTGKDKCCGECGEWEVASKKSKLPEDVKKQLTKKAAIGSLMNTMGRVGGNQKKMKPMALSPDALSAKPTPQRQLGAQTNNRFLQQSDSLRSKIAENNVDSTNPLAAYYSDSTKIASHVDVSPYITSTYVKSLPYQKSLYTEQLYTKLASLESMLTKTIPGIFKAIPGQYTSPISNAVQAAKEKYAPVTQSSAFSEGIGRLGTLFSDLGTKLKDLKPNPSAVSRLSMLQGSQPQAGALPAQAAAQPVNQAAGGARPNYARYTPKPVGDVSTKREEAARQAPVAPPALQKTPGKYATPEEYTRAALASDSKGRYFKAGLGENQVALPPQEFVNRLSNYIAVNRPGDLSGLPLQHQQTYEALPESTKEQIGGILRQNLQINALTRPDTVYQPAFGHKSIDNAVLSAADPLNSITNTLKTPTTALGLTSDQKTFSNLDNTRLAIGTFGASERLGREVAALDTKIRRDAQNGISNPDDIAELTKLIKAKRVAEISASNINLNADDKMPLFDKNLTAGEKALQAGGDLLGTIFPTMTAAQSAARFGLNSADVRKADTYGDLLGILAPTRVASTAKTIKSLLSPAATIKNTGQSISKGFADFKAAPLRTVAWRAPVAATKAVVSPTGSRIVGGLHAYSQDTPPNLEDSIRNQAIEASSSPETGTEAGSDRSKLYKYLLAAGLGIPAIMAIMNQMSGKGDEEDTEEVISEDSTDKDTPEVMYGKA